ncbi:type IV toxin-antitoxin system AbiEi family antitoxin domain-containing protein [Lachnobacterium bovis]|uniref:type IV toxin-antitoxin system AbiEi family antitoxin domain-containing protein n=1 Tax=Lachnobacterium bovis TaxID=140626 RepID=UPI0003B625A2|nr:type IV toxin-antitoxin system AbiEi family antitoxin domain-containing protein [Lachnobacterium bovis]
MTNSESVKRRKELLIKVKDFIEEEGGIAKKEDLMTLGIDYRIILDFVDLGEIVRIKNGYYTDKIDRFSETELVAKLFPDGRLCMESALYAYGYISRKPYGWSIAIDKNTSKSRFKLDYPRVIPYYTEPEVLELGSTEIEIEGQKFQIYDKERLICDCLKYEGKLERQDFKECLQSYISDEDKDICRLMEYARKRKVLRKVQTMIGIWI